MMATRGPQRRQDDLDTEASWWAIMLIAHRGKIMVLVGTLASMLTWVATTAGYSYTGPRDGIKHLSAVVDTVRTDISSLRQVNVLRDIESGHQRDQLEFLTYLLCARVPAADGYALEKCRLLRARIQPAP